MKTVLVVGRNPSQLNTDPRIPFIGAKCRKTLALWIGELHVPYQFLFVNAIDEVDAVFNSDTIHDAACKLICEKYDAQADKVIVLGNDAEKAAKAAKTDYFKLPHPSGRNRKLNDKRFISRELKKCREYLVK
jgi:uracil-DNA glycosylase